MRHRLNRHGDRQPIMALDIIVKILVVHDETTRLYAARRIGEARTYREIKRVLKRYTARAIVRELQTLLAYRHHKRVIENLRVAPFIASEEDIRCGVGLQ